MCNVGQRYVCIMYVTRRINNFDVYMHAGDRFGVWTTEGCKEVMREGNKRACECTQLAHFGILFVSPIAIVSVI